MKLGVLFSGGKDSVYALAKAKEKHEISCLISVHSENKESFMFHTPNINLTEIQAEALEIPIVIQNTKGEKETELGDLKNAIERAKKQYKIKGIVTGAIESVYQSTRIQKICDELDIWCFNPLWQADQVEHLKEIIRDNYKVVIVGIFAEPFTKKWLGKTIDEKTIKELIALHKSHKLNPAGEGGEFETLVIDGPIFKKSIEIIKSETSYENYSGTLKIKEAKLIEKN